MNHQDHVDLLRQGVQTERIADQSSGQDHPPVWADFGSGTGAFTLALADLLPVQALIYSVDRDHRALEQQERTLRARFPHHKVIYLPTDFTRPLGLPPLDGLVMANALHFQRHKLPLLRLIRGYLRPSGRFILVEYNVDRGNLWVPFPVSYSTWEKLAQQNGFWPTRRLTIKPSHFLKEIYSALSFVSKKALDA
ncbi:MAG: class I SAM-dependent methyltransferase [Anaerolineales bacterium]|jgi:SAM-dependent methyltransferase